jgi:hypothetical protein
LETKIKKFENIFIPLSTRTYIKNTVYIFVDFRIKRAGCSNYGGLLFLPPAESCQKRTLQLECVSNCHAERSEASGIGTGVATGCRWRFFAALRMTSLLNPKS